MKVPVLARVFSQQASPRLWLLAQRLIGGTPDKQAILARHHAGAARVVEVGCSIGNIARALVDRPGLRYLGLDIDEGALAFARDWFAPYPGFRFENRSLMEVAKGGERFDLVCVTGVLHHVPDPVAVEMLAGARAAAAPGARLLMFDPIPLCPGDSALYRIIHRLEQGAFLRPPEVLARMIEDAGFEITGRDEVPLGPGIVSRPHIMSLSVMTARVR